MRVERKEDGTIHLYISRRNINALLVKLDGFPHTSACTIGAPSIYDPPVYITAEEDDVHYAHPDRQGVGPGTMHPDTEFVLPEPIGVADDNNGDAPKETGQGTKTGGSS